MLLLTLSYLTPCLDFDDTMSEAFGVYHDDEVYFEEPDLIGGIEGVDYLITYGVKDEDNEA